MSISQIQGTYGDNINFSFILDDEDITLKTLFAYFVKITSLAGYNEKSWCDLLQYLTEIEEEEEEIYSLSDDLYAWVEDTIFDYEYYKENPRQNIN